MQMKKIPRKTMMANVLPRISVARRIPTSLERPKNLVLNPELLTTPVPKYKLHKQLGKGAFARVFEGQCQSQNIAIKLYNKTRLNQRGVNNILRQINTLSHVQHEALVSLKFVSEDTKNVTIGMTLAKGDPLKSVLRGGKLPQEQARWVMKSLLEAVCHLHGKGLAHRDIKLDNIVVNKKVRRAVLIDFGFSLQAKPNRTFCGTPSYMAPELIQRREYCPQKVDDWSLGVTLYIMLAGQFPFRGINELDLFRKIEKGKFQAKLLPKDAVGVVSGLLQTDPQLRMTAMEAATCQWIMAGG